MKRFSMVLSAALLVAASGAWAAETGGVKVNGYIENKVNAEENYNYAYGSGAKAYQSIGTLHGGTEVTGSLYNDVYAYDNYNAADGSDAVACQSIGSVGEFEACNK